MGKFYGIRKTNDEILKILYDDGLMDIEIATAFNTDSGTIAKRRNILGLKTKYKRGFAGRVKLIDNEILKILYDEGLSDTEISTVWGVGIDAICHARKTLHLKVKKHPYNAYDFKIYKKNCIDCNVEFEANYKHTKRCKECKDIKQQIYFNIKYLRGTYAKIKDTNPTLAKALKEEMKILDGDEFTEMALDGI